jgi:hypothetical protein
MADILSFVKDTTQISHCKYFSIIIHKYKQATIKYHLISSLSTFIPFDLKEGSLAQAQHSLTQPRSRPNMNPMAIARLFSTRS